MMSDPVVVVRKKREKREKREGEDCYLIRKNCMTAGVRREM